MRETGESYPDITLLPGLANIFQTSIDLLLGMDAIRAEEAHYQIHNSAVCHQQSGDYQAAEKVYRDALQFYPNNPGFLLGLAGTLALLGHTEDAFRWAEKGLPLSCDEKQNAAIRATLCFLYLKAGQQEKALNLASQLSHARESREAIFPLIQQDLSDAELNKNIHYILLGE